MFRGAQCRVNEGFPKPDTECKLGDIGFRYEILGTRLEETLETEWERIYRDKDVYGPRVTQSDTIPILKHVLKLILPYILCLCLWHEIYSQYYQIS